MKAHPRRSSIFANVDATGCVRQDVEAIKQSSSPQTSLVCRMTSHSSIKISYNLECVAMNSKFVHEFEINKFKMSLLEGEDRLLRGLGTRRHRANATLRHHLTNPPALNCSVSKDCTRRLLRSEPNLKFICIHMHSYAQFQINFEFPM